MTLIRYFLLLITALMLLQGCASTPKADPTPEELYAQGEAAFQKSRTLGIDPMGGWFQDFQQTTINIALASFRQQIPDPVARHGPGNFDHVVTAGDYPVAEFIQGCHGGFDGFAGTFSRSRR